MASTLQEEKTSVILTIINDVSSKMNINIKPKIDEYSPSILNIRVALISST